MRAHEKLQLWSELSTELHLYTSGMDMFFESSLHVFSVSFVGVCSSIFHVLSEIYFLERFINYSDDINRHEL